MIGRHFRRGARPRPARHGSKRGPSPRRSRGLKVEPLEQRRLLAGAEIHGSKWNDQDADSTWDAGEPGIADWKIYLDENQNGQWDTGEPFQMTGADGSYAFTGLDAGTYLVAEVAQAGWEQTYPGGASGIERVSLASDGSEGNANSLAPSVSDDGRYVAFSSEASNLVSGDTNGVVDIFVYDRQTDTIERVSVASDGSEANGASESASYSADSRTISADGRYVTFTSAASNLVPGDTNGQKDVFVCDRQTDTIERVSVASDGSQGNGWSGSSAGYPSISADGRYVAFGSAASNLVPADTNSAWDVYVHDRQAHTTERVSLASDGSEANGDSAGPSISGDGRYVAFWSTANLAPGTTADENVFIYDRQTDSIKLLSPTAQIMGRSDLPSISDDGRYVAFRCYATDLVPEDTTSGADVYVYDLQTDAIECVSLAFDGSGGTSGNFGPSVSSDGRYVAFASTASSLVSGDTNSAWDVFVHDRLTDTRQRVSIASDTSEGNGDSRAASISANGRFAAFQSDASNLVPGDTNGAGDVFVVPVAAGTHLVTLATDQIEQDVDFGNRNPPPEVTSIVRTDPSPTNAASVDFTVTFSEEVTGVDTGDFLVTADGPTEASVTSVSGSGATYTVTADTGSGDGTLRLDLSDNDSIIDGLGSPLSGPGVGNGDFTSGESYTIDRTPPAVESSVRADPSPTAAGTVCFTVSFNEAVSGVDTSDFAVTAVGPTGTSVTEVDGSGTTYAVTVDTGTGDGTLRLDLSDDDSITDTAGNPLGGPGTGNGDFTRGEAYTIDRTTPGRIEGAKWNDLDADGVWDTGEPGLLDWKIYLDEDQNGQWDTGEPYQMTGADGSYSFDSLLPGPYVVAEENQADWEQTFPSDAPHSHTINLGPGEIRQDVDFGNFLIVDLGTVAFLELAGQDPSAGTLWYRLETSRVGYLTLEATYAPAGGTAALTLLDANRSPIDSSSTGTGEERIDHQAAAAGEVYFVKLEGTNNDVDLRLANLVHQSGTTMTVYATDDADAFLFDPTASRRVTINGIPYVFTDTEAQNVTFQAGAGEDAAVLYGAGLTDTAQLWPDHGTLNGQAAQDGPAYAVTVESTESITVHGQDGADTAKLFDSAGADTLVAKPDDVRLNGTGFANRVTDFEQVHAYATAGADDVAKLYDSPGDDTLVATPGYGVFYNGGFFNRVVGFRYVHAYSLVGADVAKLYGSDGDDTFVATPDYGVLHDNSHTDFANRAVGFRYLHAYSLAGTDVAKLYDSAGEDTFVATPDYGVFYNDTFLSRAVGFRYVHGYSRAGADVAKLYDSAASQDTFVGTPDYGVFYNNAFLSRAVGFRYVHGYSRAGADVAKLYDSPGDDHLEAAANWATISYGGSWTRAVGFARVVAVSSLGGSDTKHVEATDYLLETLGPWTDV